MFSEPTINSVGNLFSGPGLGLELMGASALAFGVVCYSIRLMWTSMAYARQMEADAMQPVVHSTPHHSELTAPYCAG